MEAYIVDTTLRDGEQKAGIAFNIDKKLHIAEYLNREGIYQIEAGIPAMGGEEKESVAKIAKQNFNSIISGWNRINIEDIKHSIDCGVDIVHISAPASEIQIKEKLRKDTHWVEERLIQCIDYTKAQGFEITVGFEDASRADIDFLIRLSNLCLKNGIKRVRYADTVGILTPKRAYRNIQKIVDSVDIGIEIHTHNDFGMALVNSLAAYEGGAEFINCTLNGIGERAGNCDYYKWIKYWEKQNA